MEKRCSVGVHFYWGKCDNDLIGEIQNKTQYVDYFVLMDVKVQRTDIKPLGEFLSVLDVGMNI